MWPISLIQVTDNAGRTCLHVAASSGHYDMVQVLIGQGADLNVADKVLKQWTEPQKKRNFDWTEKGKVLSEINIRTLQEGWTALHCAAHAGYLEVAKLLVESGASAEVIFFIVIIILSEIRNCIIFNQWWYILICDIGHFRKSKFNIFVTQDETKNGRVALWYAASEGHNAVTHSFAIKNLECIFLTIVGTCKFSGALFPIAREAQELFSVGR